MPESYLLSFVPVYRIIPRSENMFLLILDILKANNTWSKSAMGVKDETKEKIVWKICESFTKVLFLEEHDY